jgi:hypothetical protein
MAGFLNLRAILGLNASGFHLGMKQAESAAKAFGRSIKREFGNAFGVAAITAYSAKVVNLADEITDLSDRLGISAKTLQEWKYAADRSGASIEKLTFFWENLAKAREKALEGDSKAQSLFWQFGVNPSELGQMGTAEMTVAIQRKVKNTQNPNDISPALNAIGGRGASSLIPLFKSDIEGLTREANELGRVIDNEAIAQLKSLKSEIMELSSLAIGPAAIGLGEFGKVLRSVMHSVSRWTAVSGAIAANWTQVQIPIGDKSALAKERLEKGLLTPDEFTSIIKEMVAEVDARYESKAQKASAGTGYNSQIGPQPLERIFGMPLRRRGGSSSGGGSDLDLTSNQRVGALVRFDPNSNSLRNIDRNTGRMVSLLEDQKREATVNVGRGNFGAEREEWQ